MIWIVSGAIYGLIIAVIASLAYAVIGSFIYIDSLLVKTLTVMLAGFIGFYVSGYLIQSVYRAFIKGE